MIPFQSQIAHLPIPKGKSRKKKKKKKTSICMVQKNHHIDGKRKKKKRKEEKKSIIRMVMCVYIRNIQIRTAYMGRPQWSILISFKS